MKISTLLIMVTLSASCFAAPVHTAYEGPAVGATGPDRSRNGDASGRSRARRTGRAGCG